MRTIAILAGVGVVVAGVIGAVALFADTPEAEIPADATILELPSRGEVRPDYLDDGTPVWVTGHDDGSVSVLSGFDTHRPFGVGKLLWWCRTADAFENPEHGSRYDEYGIKIGGPAPSGLPTYAIQVDGERVAVGQLQEGAPVGTEFSGPAEVDRTWCHGPAGVIAHTFDGWKTWDSPTAAVEAAPDGWILLAGQLAINDANAVVLCAQSGCDDAVRALNISTPDPNMEFGPLFGERFIARVREGALDAVTRVPSPAGP